MNGVLNGHHSFISYFQTNCEWLCVFKARVLLRGWSCYLSIVIFILQSYLLVPSADSERRLTDLAVSELVGWDYLFSDLCDTCWRSAGWWRPWHATESSDEACRWTGTRTQWRRTWNAVKSCEKGSSGLRCFYCTCLICWSQVQFQSSLGPVYWWRPWDAVKSTNKSVSGLWVEMLLMVTICVLYRPLLDRAGPCSPHCRSVLTDYCDVMLEVQLSTHWNETHTKHTIKCIIFKTLLVFCSASHFVETDTKNNNFIK